MIHVADKIKLEIYKVNYACGILLDLQKAFDTVGHHILLKKVEYYDVIGISSKCLHFISVAVGSLFH